MSLAISVHWGIGKGWTLWRSEVSISNDFCLCPNMGAYPDLAETALGKQNRPQRMGEA